MFDKFLIRSFAIVLGCLAVSTVPAYADITTGFEPPEYTVGPLAGQNGWQVFGPAVVTVEDFMAFGGTQAVFVDGGASATSQSGPYIGTTAGPLLDLSAEIYLASSGTETSWQFADIGAGLIGFAGGIDIYPTIDPLTSSIYAITGSGGDLVGTFTRNQWNNVSIDLNFTTQTYNIVLNGVTLASNLAFCGNNAGTCNGATVSDTGNDGLFDTFGGVSGSNDDGFMDNYSAITASAPEPGSLLLLGSMLALIAAGGFFAARARS
jgi:hypothetical protein